MDTAVILFQQKIVIKVAMPCYKCRSKAMALVAKTRGVDSMSIAGDSKDQVVVVGESVDSVKLAAHQRAAQEGGIRAPGVGCRRRREGREETGRPRCCHCTGVPVLLPLPGTAAGDRRLRVPRLRVRVRVPVPVSQNMLHNVMEYNRE
jgi:hypothetical protein